jgi:hypothetical protein
LADPMLCPLIGASSVADLRFRTAPRRTIQSYVFMTHRLRIDIS